MYCIQIRNLMTKSTSIRVCFLKSATFTLRVGNVIDFELINLSCFPQANAFKIISDCINYSK